MNENENHPEHTNSEYLKSRNSSIEKLIEQFKGRMFGELVLHHVETLSPEKIALAIIEFKNNIHPALQKNTDDFLYLILNKWSFSKEFWNVDCGKALYAYTNSTKIEARKNGIEVSDDYAFDFFNLVVDSLADKAVKDPSFKKFIKKSVRKFRFFKFHF
jgi:hypothetical protein